MSSWKANCSRWSVTISRVAVIGSPVVLGATLSVAAACPGSHLIPSQIIGINRRSVNDVPFSADETTDVGYESWATISSELTPESSRFNGKIEWVQIDLGDD